MSVQNVSGKVCTNGPKGYLEIPLLTELTDGTQAEIFTDANVTVTAQSLGIYGEGQRITGGFMSAKTGIVHCVVINNGIVRAILPLTSRTSGATGCSDMQVANPITLVPGDQLIGLTYA